MSEHVCDAVCNQHENAGAQARDRQWAEAVEGLAAEWERRARAADISAARRQPHDQLAIELKQASRSASAHAEDLRALVERMKGGGDA